MTEPVAGNGILVKVRADDIAAGSHLLPPAGPGQPVELTAVVDTPNLGKVRITYRLKRSPRKKTGIWFWTAGYAEVVAAERQTPDCRAELNHAPE